MAPNPFDNLTRQVATSATRRQVLKGVVTFAVGSFLSQFGFKPHSHAYAQSSPSQAGDQALFIPFARKVCEEASNSDKIIECGDPCRCIRSTEGAILCGTPPSCDGTPKCKSSADCAHLGTGYFCDVPFSGGCADNELSRCVPPCGIECPAEDRCGSHCCGNGQTCSGDHCVSTYDCDTQYITPSALKTALAALDAGATRADISTQGCIHVEQKLVDNEVVTRYLIFGTTAVSIWNMTESEIQEELDFDNDGFKEWRSLTTFGKTDDDFNTVETEYDPATQKPVRRTTVTPEGTMTHFVIEEADAKGEWKVVLDYETPRIQPATLGDEYRTDEVNNSAVEADLPCEANPCDPAELQKRMSEGIDNAANCLPDIGPRALDLYLKSYNLQKRKMTFQCAAIPGNPQATIGGWDRPRGPLTVTVDPAKYCKLDNDQRGWILYHEVLHATLRSGHKADVEALPEEHRKQLDRVYGCMALCYNNKAHPTRCMCAQCLGTVTCDPICLPYDSDCGATCPCVTQNNKYFSTCTGCLVDCPSGLGCFGTSYCEPVGQSPVCPPQTCPP